MGRVAIKGLFIYDGVRQWRGGVDSSVAPTELLPGQVSWGVNSTFRQTYPQPRPGFTKVASFAAGLWQGGHNYIAADGTPYIVAAVGGNITAFNVNTFAATSLTGMAGVGQNNVNQQRTYFVQAENWLIANNNLNPPIFWNGITARRSNGFKGPKNPLNEIPVGGPMAYGKGRIWVAVGNSYIGGDLIGSNINLPAPGTDSILQVTENDYLATGGSFTIPGSGGVTALKFVANIDTSLGDGDLLVFGYNGIWAFNAPEDATTWKSLTYPIQRFALLNFGSYNQDSISLVNGDAYFRSEEGVRSYFYARRDFTSTWGQTPLSRELIRVLNFDSQNLLYAASSVTFDNRFIMTCLPQADPVFGVYHLGLVALDFNWVGGIGQKFPPAWEGVWTGLKVLQIMTVRVNSIDRCFAFVANQSAQQIEIWEITRDQQFDFDGTTQMPIQWILELPSVSFAGPTSAPTDWKRLINGELWIDRVNGQVSSFVEYRPSLEPIWYPWNQVSICTTAQDCATTTCHAIQPYQAQSFDRLALGVPQTDVNPSQNTMSNWAYDFQTRLTNVGFFRLKTFRFQAEPKDEKPFGDLSHTVCTPPSGLTCDTSGCPSLIGCDPADYTYHSSPSN